MNARWFVGTIAVAAALLAPTAAQATEYFASDDGTGDCLTVSTPCKIGTALALIDDVDTPDILHLAAGEYTDGVEDSLPMSGANFSGTTIEGAGRDQTILRPSGQTLPFRFGLNSQGGVTVRDLTLDGSGADPASPATVSSAGGSTTLEDVTVISRGSTANHNAIALSASAGNATIGDLQRVIVQHYPNLTTNGASAIDVSSAEVGGSLTVEDSQIDALDNGAAISGIRTTGRTGVTVLRSAIRMRQNAVSPAGGGIEVLAQGPDPVIVNIEDNSITGGAEGIGIRNNSNAGGTQAHVLRNSVDAGEIAIADALGDAKSLIFFTPTGNAINATVRDNAFVDGLVGIEDTAPAFLNFVDCTSNAVVDAALIDIDADVVPQPTPCTNSVSGGTVASNFPNLTAANAWNPAALPFAAHGAAFTPGTSSIVLDNASGVGAGATDLAGLPRAVDSGDADCIAQQDRGAYELQGHATPLASCDPVTGNPKPKPPIVTPPVVPPAISAIGLSPKSPKSKSAAKAKVSFTLNKAVTVTLRLARQEKGRKVGKACKKPTRRNRTKKACKRFVKVGKTAKVAGKAGLNKVRLSKLIGKKRLKAGRYRLTLSAPGTKARTLNIKVRR